MEHSWAEHSGAGRTVPTVYNNMQRVDITFVRTVCLITGEHSSPLRCYRIFYKKREGKPLPYGVKEDFYQKIRGNLFFISISF